MHKIALFVFSVIILVEVCRLLFFFKKAYDSKGDRIIKFIVTSKNLTTQEKFFCEELLYKDDGKYLDILKGIIARIEEDNPIHRFKDANYYAGVFYECPSYIESCNVKKLVFYWLKARGYEEYVAIPKSSLNATNKVHMVKIEFYRRPSIEELAKVLEYDPHGITGEYINRIDFIEPTIYTQYPQYMLYYGNTSTKVITHYELLAWIEGTSSPKL